MDAYEVAPFLLARSEGSENLKKAVIASFDRGECRQVLEKLENSEISIDDAVAQISKIMDLLHDDALR